MSICDNPIFQNVGAAREWLEALLWPEGPVCPHCGLIGAAYALHGKKQRAGLYECKGCSEQFTVTVGTVCERSHIPLNKWVFAFHLIAASKKGVSAHQMHRMLGITYKSAWFMMHRIREALTTGTFPTLLGGANKVVEIDETYVGGKEANKHAWRRTPGSQGGKGKAPVLALVEREGRVRSQHVANVNGKTLGPILHKNIDRATHLMTDDATVYPPLTKGFAGHSSVNHSAEEYVRLAGFAHTNTVENYFSILKHLSRTSNQLRRC
jgi:transposase-like protein